MKGTLLIIEDEFAFAESVKVAIEEINSSITIVDPIIRTIC